MAAPAYNKAHKLTIYFVSSWRPKPRPTIKHPTCKLSPLLPITNSAHAGKHEGHATSFRFQTDQRKPKQFGNTNIGHRSTDRWYTFFARQLQIVI